MGPNGCRETRGAGTKETTRNRGRILAFQKVRFFSLHVAEYESHKEQKWALLFHSKWDKWQAFFKK